VTSVRSTEATLSEMPGNTHLIRLSMQKRLIGSTGPFELNVDFTVPKGELVVLNGVSGAGKTTLLRMLAGLEHPDDGDIVVDNETWFDAGKKVRLPPQRRSVGLVFQNYALFPSMTVRRNLEFAAGRRKDPRLDMLLEMVELDELQYRHPEELSGGQQQRVALARALIRQPKILLLDEPLSALDDEMRHKLQEEIRRLHADLGLTTILVSHDRSEILRMADRVLVLHEGSVAFDGPPIQAFPDDATGSAHPLHAQVVNMTKDNGFVRIVAAPAGMDLRVEIRLSEGQLQELLARRVS
jgi:molybdate transport system ATP-binding protein